MNGKSSGNVVVLTLDTGIVHEDYEQTAACLAKLGVIRATCNIYDERRLSATLSAIENDEVDVIETRHIRKWQQNWPKVRPLFESVEAAARKRSVPMIPTPTMFRWNSNKAGYLREMADQRIAITPTIFLEPGETCSLAKTVAQFPAGVVIKPAIGARAHGLHFVRRLSHALFEIATPREAEGSLPVRVEKANLNVAALEEFFQRYRDSFGKQIVLVQELIPEKIEYSGVMISGVETYYIKRLEGESTGIGHDAFGGTNVVEPAPGRELVDFVENVRKAIPAMLRDEPIIRVDALVCKGRKPMLLEIESGGPRLFNEAGLGNTVEGYSAMLLAIGKSSRALMHQQGSRKGMVNENLAPLPDILERLFGSTPSLGSRQTESAITAD